MLDQQRLKLRFGPYRTPKFKYGARVMDEIRGEVEIVALHDGPIPWPVGKRGRVRALILCGDLARAVRHEANIVVQHWWGVKHATVRKWRRALGVAPTNAGTSQLRREHFDEHTSVGQGARPWASGEDRGQPARKTKSAARHRRHARGANRQTSLGRGEGEDKCGTPDTRHSAPQGRTPVDRGGGCPVSGAAASRGGSADRPDSICGEPAATCAGRAGWPPAREQGHVSGK
ncbi:MAG TPA: hypothetical protein VG826_14910 [Pirellulales bacterium]|nr:hypothetical protein [Pirellulales bacterium]